MVLLITSIVLMVIILIGTLSFGVYAMRKLRTKKYMWLACVSPIAFLILLFGCFCKVGANEVGIIYHDKHGVLDEVKYEGFQSKSIYEHITKIKTTNRTAQVRVAGQTKDSIYADFEITVVYRIDAENAGKFFKRTSSTDISADQLNSICKETLQSSTIKYDIYAILGEQLEIVRQDFVKDLTKVLTDRYAITLVSSSFDDIDAGTRVEEIIKQKAESQQKIEIAELEKLQAEIEALTAQVKANAEAEIVRIKAQAEADKVGLEKTAIADMINDIYEKTKQDDGTYLLTYKQCAEIVLQQIYYDKWDGVLPDYLGGDNTSIILPSLSN